MSKTLIVNLFGSPGAGKSRGAAYIFSRLKTLNVNVELVTEFAKEKYWEGSSKVFDNQAYIFGEQYFRITRLLNEVDVIVTDSPIALSAFYNHSERLGERFNEMVIHTFNSYDDYQLNYLLKRSVPYNPKGRFQTESQSDNLYYQMSNFLYDHNISFLEVLGDDFHYDVIVEDIMNRIKQ